MGDDERKTYKAQNLEAKKKSRQKIKEREDRKEENLKPTHDQDKVTCINCKKKLKQIYFHIMGNEECAKFYVLEDERKTYKAQNLEAKKKSRQKIKEREDRKEENL